MSGQAQGAAILTPLAASAFDVEFLTREQMVAEDVMLGARMVNGVDAGLCAYASRVFGYEKTQAVFCALRDRGLIWYREGRWRPTHTGWLMGNELFGELWDLAPDHGTIHMEVQP
jgi:oxygen-independent coproporphyrinogen-3 oxidase